MDLELFREILDIDSTSGRERALAEYLETEFGKRDPLLKSERYEVGDGTLNLLFKWGDAPQVFLCSHLDTVPPYISPEFRPVMAGDILPDGKIAGKDDILITGRGSCDAKGQFLSMWTACESLAEEGYTGFALLLLSGEETGSFGAKAYTRDCPGADRLIVGEPTDNKMVSASKGTKAFNVTIHGTPCHSGYPELGHSAVDIFIDMIERLRGIRFPEDPVLGKTTWNIGKLLSDNPQNILSPLLKFRIYFRTTFASDQMVQDIMASFADGADPECKSHTKDTPVMEMESLGGDTPMKYDTFSGYDTKPVAFGSDTPRMTKFTHRSLCGPGSIFVAHTPEEYVLLSELDRAVEQYKDMVRRSLINNI